MVKENQEASAQNKSSLEQTRWYYITVFVLAILSLVTLNRNVAGGWEVTLGFRETTPILVALAILPSLLSFLRDTPPGTKRTAKMGPIEGSSERLHQIDEKLAENQEKHETAGEAVKDQTTRQSDIEKMRRDADVDLEKTVTPQELPFVQPTYLQKLNELVKDFNRNRHIRESGRDTLAEAGEIAYKMRSMAPLLFGQLDISTWLDRPNLGKQLAAIKYLDWSQDIEFAEALASRLQVLEEKGDTFQAFHTLLALHSMANQLAYDCKDKIMRLLKEYTPKTNGDSSREHVKKRILDILS